MKAKQTKVKDWDKQMNTYTIQGIHPKSGKGFQIPVPAYTAKQAKAYIQKLNPSFIVTVLGVSR